jgi:N-acetylmuramidase
MTPRCELFLKAVMARTWWQAYTAAGGLSPNELFYAVAALDPLDRAMLRAARGEAVGLNSRIIQAQNVAAQFVRQSAPSTSLLSVLAEHPHVEFPVARVGFALDVVTTGAVPAAAASGLQPGDTAAAWAYVGRKYADPKALPFEHDLTDMLPPANPGAPALTDQDYESAAKELGVEVAAIRAVAAVESQGQGFHGGRPTLRYELHIFQNGFAPFAGTGGIYHASHPHLSQPKGALGEQFHDGTQAREYSLLHAAMILSNGVGGRRYGDAWQSASWGKFQVLGVNYAGVGWVSLESFVSSMYESEQEHLRAFLGYVKWKDLTGYIRDHNWWQFANHYNSNGKASKDNKQVNGYAASITAAYNRFRRPQPAGRR